MIKIFTKNKNGKIEMTEHELKCALDEAYWEGYKSGHAWTYITPNWSPYVFTSNDITTSVVLNSNDYDIKSNTCDNPDYEG